MKRNSAARLYMWGVILTFAATGCSTQSDAAKIAALVPTPLTPSAELTETLERVERLLDATDDPTHSVSQKLCQQLLAQVKVRYGNTKNNADSFRKQIKELNAQKLEPEEKENALGMLLFGMSESSLAPDAARKAAAHSSPTIRAIAPTILGRLQVIDKQYENAGESFKRSLTMLKTAPESSLKTAIIFLIATLAETDDSLSDVFLLAEECIPKKPEAFQSFPRFMFVQMWCKIHKTDLAAGNFEMFLKRAEEETDDRAKTDYVRAVIKEQMRQGNFDEVPKTIDRIFPPGMEKKNVAADRAAIFGRFDGRDLCIETWAIACTQYGKLAEAMNITDSIEEMRRRNSAISKMIVVLMGKDIKAADSLGLLLESVLGGDLPSDEIPTPQYSDAEILDFCHWYATTAEQQRYTNEKIQWTASAARLMRRFGFTKEADELFDKALADVLATEERNRIYAVSPIIDAMIATGDSDKTFELIEKLPEHGIDVRVYQKIEWFCAMDKFDNAIALAEEEHQERGNYWSRIVRALIAVDRKEDAKQLLEKVFALETVPANENFIMLPDNALVGAMLRAGMFEELFRYVECFLQPEAKARLLTFISQQQRTDGNTAEADKTLLEAVKQVEKMGTAVGNQHTQLQGILMGLLLDPKMFQQAAEQAE